MEATFDNNNITSISKRAFAALLDYGVVFCCFFIYIFSFGEPDEEGSYQVKGFLTLPLLIFWLIYIPIIESINGQTLGKFLLNIKVIAIETQKPSFNRSLKRHLLDIIDFSFLGITGILIAKNTPKSQRLGDLYSKTIVINNNAT